MELNIIYKLTSPSGKVYIGRTQNFERRMIEHKSAANKIFNRSLYKAIRKYGWDSFKTEILAECDNEDTAQIVEETLIKKFNSVKLGYNDTYGGSGRNMFKDNPELLEKLKRTLSLKFSGDKNPMYGKTHNAETLDKLKQKAKGRFSLQWYIDRNGIEEGSRLYEERCIKLKNRNMPKDQNGKFTKST
jgi:group I intron endonuclease